MTNKDAAEIIRLFIKFWTPWMEAYDKKYSSGVTKAGNIAYEVLNATKEAL
jgi:hypothetical protein